MGVLGRLVLSYFSDSLDEPVILSLNIHAPDGSLIFSSVSTLIVILIADLFVSIIPAYSSIISNWRLLLN